MSDSSVLKMMAHFSWIILTHSFINASYWNACIIIAQVCPQAADVVELFIYLGEPCHVCQLLLTISHGADDSTYPSTVDVRTGRYLDGLKLVLEVCCSSFIFFP